MTDKSIWEDFLMQCKEKTFLQSWNWGEFSQAMGEKIWRFGFYGGNKLGAVALVIKKVARRGTFLLVPHGPLSQLNSPSSKVEIIEMLLARLKEVASNERASFIRINPLWERNAENGAILRNAGFRPAPILIHPESSWKLDITANEEELLKNMRKTTRYLIRQTLKNKDIQVFQSKDIDDIKIFSNLHTQLSKTQRFVPFSFDYLKNEFLAFHKDNEVALFVGRYKREVAAAAFVIFWSGIGFYHHAVSLPQFAKQAVPYLLQWEAIREAKRRGCLFYDFWGFINPQAQASHPWAGPTLFKMGFGGRAYEYVKTHDFPLHWKYWAVALFETLRRLHRHL